MYLKLYSFTCNYIQRAYFWKKTGVFCRKTDVKIFAMHNFYNKKGYWFYKNIR